MPKRLLVAAMSSGMLFGYRRTVARRSTGYLLLPPSGQRPTYFENSQFAWSLLKEK